MGKNGGDRKGKNKASNVKQATPGKTTGKRQYTNGSPHRLSASLVGLPEHMFLWGVRMPTTTDNVVPPNFPSTVPVWNINDPQPTTNAIGQPSLGQAAAGVPVAVSSDLHAREDHDLQESSSANATPHAPEIQAEVATSSRIPGLNPDVHGALPTPIDQGSRWLPPVPLQAFHPNSPHTPLHASDSRRYHPYRQSRVRPSSQQAAQFEEARASRNGGTNISHSGDIPRVIVNGAQVRSFWDSLPPPSIHRDTGAFCWMGTMDLAALGDAVVQAEALGFDIAGLPTQVHRQHAESLPQAPQTPPAYPSIAQRDTLFFEQNTVAGPSSQRQEDHSLVASHHTSYHPGNARPWWGVSQDWSPSQPNQPVAGPSENEDPLSELGALDVPLSFEFSDIDDWYLRPPDGSPPPPTSGSQWQQ